jgi:CheY-like chemotaxis protein
MGASSIPIVGQRPNSVNLRTPALDSLLDKFDTPQRKATGSIVNRNFVRWPYRRESVEVKVVHPGGNLVSIRVACRNISRGGLSVLHNSFLHPGSECRVMLTHPTKGLVETPGTVVRCQHRSGVIHELGISFSDPINVKEFLQTDPLSNTFSLERVNPSDLHGRLLLVDPSAADRSILKHFLRETALEVESVSSMAEVVLACDSADVILINSEVPDGDLSTVLSTLRECRYDGPVILTVPDASPETRARLTGVTAQAILVNPITQNLLMRAIAEVLIVDPPSGRARHSRPSPQSSMAHLASIGKELYAAASARNGDSISDLCARLLTLAESMGWNALMRQANDVMSSLGRGRTVEQVLPAIEQIMAACDNGPPQGEAQAAPQGRANQKKK